MCEREERRKTGIQQLWIIDIGQEGDVTRCKRISSYISTQTEEQLVVDMLTGRHKHFTSLLKFTIKHMPKHIYCIYLDTLYIMCV